MTVTLLTAGLGLVAASAPAAAGDQQYRVVDLGMVGRTLDVNDHRQAVGEFQIDIYVQHPFLWERGRLIDLGVLAHGYFEYGEATDINNRGQIVGDSAVADWVEHAFLWENGVMTDLGTLGGQWSKATRINDRGQIIGWSQTAAGEFHAVMWQDGVITDLEAAGIHMSVSDINNRGQMVGSARFGDVVSAALWDGGRLIQLDSRPSAATAINETGWVVGYVSHPELDNSEAYLWRWGVATSLGTAGEDSGALDVNNRGQVVGTSFATGRGAAFVWWNGVLTDLAQYGFYGSVNIAAINNRGDIAAAPYQPAHGSAVLYLR